MEVLEFVTDPKKSKEQNLKDCLADQLIVYSKKDPKGNLVFRVEDDELDTDFDIELINTMAPHLETGSFYESDGDYFMVVEVERGRLKVSYYELERDEDTGAELNRTLWKSHFWGKEYDDDEDDDLDDDSRFALLESHLIVPKAKLEELNRELNSKKKKFVDVQDRVLYCLREAGWLLQSENSRELVFELDPQAFIVEVEHPDSIVIYQNMTIYKYGGALKQRGSFIRFSIDGGSKKPKIYELTIQNRKLDEDRVPHLSQRALSHKEPRFYQPCPTLIPEDPLVIDTAAWKTKDKAWVKRRQKQWTEVERTLGREKTKKGLNIVKRYFMTGKLPDWRKVNASWNYEDTHGRHLDLFSLLYCYPVQDYEVLKPLRDGYLAGEAVGRERRDVFAGCHTFLALALRDASSNGKEYGASRKHFVCDAEMMLRLLFEDTLDGKPSSSALEVSFRNGPNIYGLSFIEKWLELDKLNQYGQRMLMQHDLALELMYANICALEGQDRRRLFVDHTGARWERIFYGLHHYDFKREGDTIRSEVVTKLTQMLNEREWIPEVKQIWERVKQDDTYGRGLDKGSNDPLQLDLSFWKPNNKTWLAQREAEWPHVEKLLKLTKKKDGLVHCKAYFLTGKLPNWPEASQIWEGGSRVGGHLDLSSLLLLHPSDDYAVLQPLRDQYLSGRWYGRKGLDLLAGFELFKTLGFRCPCENGQKPYTKPRKNGGPYSLGEKAEVVTRLFYEVIDQPFDDDDLRAEYRHATHVDFDFMRQRDYIEELVRIAEWLCFESLSDAGGRIIYQYDIAATHLIQALRLKLTDRDFIGYLRGWQTILYRLYHFDAHIEEPDVARAAVVRQLCAAFDEPGWPKLMGEIRDDVKANKLQLENPWGQAFKWR